VEAGHKVCAILAILQLRGAHRPQALSQDWGVCYVPSTRARNTHPCVCVCMGKMCAWTHTHIHMRVCVCVYMDKINRDTHTHTHTQTHKACICTFDSSTVMLLFSYMSIILLYHLVKSLQSNSFAINSADDGPNVCNVHH